MRWNDRFTATWTVHDQTQCYAAGMSTISVDDTRVDDALDAELRTLLSTCFTGPHNAVFRTQRHFRVPPLHRWLRRDATGLTVHLAAHDLNAAHAGGTIRFAGIAEVCVRPDCRGQGLVRAVLDEAHHELAAMGFHWAALFGKPEVYASSGYRATGQPIRHVDGGVIVEKAFPSFQVRALGPAAGLWPDGVIDLRGPTF